MYPLDKWHDLVLTSDWSCFRSVVAYRTTIQPVFTPQAISQGGKVSLYDSVDEEVLRSYREFSLASLLFFAMKESACSEQSQRMTAMDSATKNAGTLNMPTAVSESCRNFISGWFDVSSVTKTVFRNGHKVLMLEQYFSFLTFILLSNVFFCVSTSRCIHGIIVLDVDIFSIFSKYFHVAYVESTSD